MANTDDGQQVFIAQNPDWGIEVMAPGNFDEEYRSGSFLLRGQS